VRTLVGIDENGLGPRLGPLIVTAVSARCDERGAKVASSRPGRAFSRLGDSKDLVAHGDTSLGEAWACALAARTRPDAPRATPDDLVHALSIDGRDALRARCPKDHEAQCWATDDERFVAEPKLLGQVTRDIDRLAARGVMVTRVDVLTICTERINAAVDRGQSRFVVDLHAMERLALVARDAAGGEIDVTCGKVGGYDRYEDAFGPLAGRLRVTIAEGRARSTYRFPGLGTIAFVRDADAGNLLVGMASLVGKWVRDLLMDRVVRYHQRYDADLPRASGYHDPVTSHFVSATALTRTRRKLPNACFERRRLD